MNLFNFAVELYEINLRSEYILVELELQIIPYLKPFQINCFLR